MEKHSQSVETPNSTPITLVEAEETISIEEAEEYLWDKLKVRFGTDLRKRTK